MLDIGVGTEKRSYRIGYDSQVWVIGMTMQCSPLQSSVHMNSVKLKEYTICITLERYTNTLLYFSQLTYLKGKSMDVTKHQHVQY